MKTKEEIIAVIEKIKSLNIALSVADYEAVLHYLKLSTLNPMKIDEERFMNCFYNHFQETMFAKRNLNIVFDEYNSTCKDHQVLQPLPSEMPESFGYYYGNNVASDVWDKIIQHYGTPKSELQPLPENPPDWFNKMFNWASPEDSRKIWSEIINHYGTPTKKELVSVDELAKEIKNIYVPCSEEKKLSYVIAQHIIDTYSLNAPKREWWMDCEKFMYKGRVYKKYSYEIFPDGHTVLHAELSRHDIKDCTPYIEPSIHDKFMASLSDEQKKMYEEIKEATK